MDASVQGLSEEDISRNRRNIKKHLLTKSFFSYLSGDYIRIRDFSRKNGIIQFSFFIFPKLDANLPERFIQQIQRTLASPLDKALQQLIDNGWRVFDKAIYNKIVLLKSLTESLSEIKPDVFDHAPAKMLEDFRSIERNFFILYQDRDFVPDFERELSLYVKMNHHKKFPVDGVIRAIQMLLTSNDSRLTLYSFFISLNAIHCRSLVPIEEMIREGNRQYVMTDDFEVDSHTSGLINNYRSELVAAVEKQLTNHQEVMLYRGIISLAAKDYAANLRILQKFYNHGLNNEDRYSADTPNILVFMFNFSQKFLIQAKRFLLGTFPMIGQKTGRVFDQTVFTNYLSRISYLKDKLDRIIVKVPKFEKNRYLRVLSEGNLNVDASEEQIFAVLSEMLNHYFQIAKILALVLKHASPSRNPETVPVIRPLAYADVQFFIPFEQTEQYSSSFLAGLKVREAITRIASTLLILCMDMKEAELITVLNKDHHTVETLKHLLKELQRVSTPWQYRDYEERMNLATVEQEING